MPAALGAGENLTTRGTAGCPEAQAGRRDAEPANPRGTEAWVHGCERDTGGQAGVRPGGDKVTRGTSPQCPPPRAAIPENRAGNFHP